MVSRRPRRPPEQQMFVETSPPPCPARPRGVQGRRSGSNARRNPSVLSTALFSTRAWSLLTLPSRRRPMPPPCTLSSTAAAAAMSFAAAAALSVRLMDMAVLRRRRRRRCPRVMHVTAAAECRLPSLPPPPPPSVISHGGEIQSLLLLSSPRLGSFSPLATLYASSECVRVVAVGDVVVLLHPAFM